MQESPHINSARIRIGIILESAIVEKWTFKVLERLRNSDFVEITYIIYPDKNESDDENFPSLIFQFHQLLDTWLYSDRYDYNRLVDCTELIKESTIINNDQSGNHDYHGVNNPGVSVSQNHELDLLVNLTSHKVPQKLLAGTIYGVLSFNIEGKRYPGNPEAGYISLASRRPEIDCHVSLTTQGCPEQTVVRSSVSTFSNSIHINRSRVLGLAELLIPRAVRYFHLMSKEGRPVPQEAPLQIDHSSGTKSNTTSSFKALVNFIGIHFRSLRKKLFFLNNENWFLLYKQDSTSESLRENYSDLEILEPPAGFYWADPFAVLENGKKFLFIEEYAYETCRGHLAVIRQDESGSFGESTVIIKKPYHLSYPFIFKHEGQYFMIPETKAQRVIQLYHCSNFPENWEFVTNLMENVAAADTTVFFHRNKWWLFTSLDILNNPEINFGELFLFYTDDLFSGHWTSHPKNPVVSEIGKSRPAGGIFERDGMLIRPSQDCSGGYGKAVNLNHIVRISETEYEEVIIKRIAPDWNPALVGMHTFNLTNGFYVLDACKLRKRFGR